MIFVFLLLPLKFSLSFTILIMTCLGVHTLDLSFGWTLHASGS